MTGTVVRSLSQLKGLLASGTDAITKFVNDNPDLFAELLREVLDSVPRLAADHEARIRMSVYDDAASLLSTSFPVSKQNALQWVLRAVSDPDVPADPSPGFSADRIASTIDSQIVLRVIYEREQQSGAYKRHCELYTQREGDVRKITKSAEVGLDTLPSDVVENFLKCGESHQTFRLYPR